MSRLLEPNANLTADSLNILFENDGDSPIRKTFRTCGAAHGLSTANAAGPGLRAYECPGAERAFACLNAGVIMANQVDGENGLYSESAKGAVPVKTLAAADGR